jgi:hypothetical protein
MPDMSRSDHVIEDRQSMVESEQSSQHSQQPEVTGVESEGEV